MDLNPKTWQAGLLQFQHRAPSQETSQLFQNFKLGDSKDMARKLTRRPTLPSKFYLIWSAGDRDNGFLVQTCKQPAWQTPPQVTPGSMGGAFQQGGGSTSGPSSTTLQPLMFSITKVNGMGSALWMLLMSGKNRERYVPQKQKPHKNEGSQSPGPSCPCNLVLQVASCVAQLGVKGHMESQPLTHFK